MLNHQFNNLKITSVIYLVFKGLQTIIFSRNMTIHDFNSEKIAEQMTLLDLELFQKIEVIFVRFHKLKLIFKR